MSHYHDPVFRLLGHLLGVKRQKSLRTTFFQLCVLESYGDFFLGQLLILFVRKIIVVVGNSRK